MQSLVNRYRRSNWKSNVIQSGAKRSDESLSVEEKDFSLHCVPFEMTETKAVEDGKFSE